MWSHSQSLVRIDGVAFAAGGPGRLRVRADVPAGELADEDAEAADLGVLLAVKQLAGGAGRGVADQGTGLDGWLGGEEAAGHFKRIGTGTATPETVKKRSRPC